MAVVPYNGRVSEAIRSRAFERAMSAAARLIGSRSRLGRLLRTAAARLRDPSRALATVREDALALVRMVRESRAGRYRRLPQKTLIAIAAGLLYLINPLDLLPDMIPAIGLLDDATILAWVVSQVRRDLEQFRAWEGEWGGAIDVDWSEADPEPEPPALPSGTG